MPDILTPKERNNAIHRAFLRLHNITPQQYKADIETWQPDGVVDFNIDRQAEINMYNIALLKAQVAKDNLRHAKKCSECNYGNIAFKWCPQHGYPVPCTKCGYK